MITILKSIPVYGMSIYAHKQHWLSVLKELQRLLGHQKFYFEFSAERGYNLKVFAFEKFEITFKEELQKFLNELSQLSNQNTDPFFDNIPTNTFKLNNHYYLDSHSIELAQFFEDTTGHSEVNPETYKEFLVKLADVIIDALAYNSFFLEEKNRINFAIQLLFTFTTLISNEKGIEDFKREMNEILGNTVIPADPIILNFYRETRNLKISDENDIWLNKWLEMSTTTKNTFDIKLISRNICKVLEIEKFTPNLLTSLKSVMDAQG